MNTSLLIALLVPFAGTVLGAACVFLLKDNLPNRVQKGLLGFASGVMVAAAVWSLLIPALEMAAGSGAAASGFAGKMAATSAGKVLIAGLETHSAVMQTALDFKGRGYDVTVIEDCCASRNGHDHKMAIERLRDAGCTITTGRAAVMELIGTVSHPAAEAVARILG